MSPQLSIISPLYNEQETLPLLVQRLDSLMNSLGHLSIEVVLIDDGSRDNTPALMQALALANPRYHCVFLARNHGHQLALTAGIAAARATEAMMIIDGDLQDPPELLGQFYDLYKQGYDVVYAVREKRKENIFKRMAYYSFYRILKQISYIDIPLDSGDFSLISRRIANVLNKMPEESRFLRGMRTWIGFKQIGVKYERSERAAGEPKYNFAMLFKLAYNGIFNFSEFPIRFVSGLGVFTVLMALMYFLGVVIKKYFFHEVIEGFPALLFMVILFGGVQLLAIGIIGEYILRIFFQGKNRPLFIIKSVIKDGMLVEQ